MRLAPLAKTCSGGDFSPQPRTHEKVITPLYADSQGLTRASDCVEITENQALVPFYGFLGALNAQHRAAERVRVNGIERVACSNSEFGTPISVNAMATRRVERQVIERVDVVTKYVATTRAAIVRRGLIDVVV